MNTRGRIAALVAVIVIAVVTFVVLKPDDKKTTDAGVRVTVKGGKPVGGIKEIGASKGDRVRFVVQSDVSDEIHVHGYDFMKDVKAGGQVSFSFPAKIDGEFDIELEKRGEQIAKLVVQP
jgi:hypothetical protein